MASDLDDSLPPFGALESPAMDAAVTGNSLLVKGWALDNKGIASLHVRVDGVDLANIPVDKARPDGCATWPGYAMCNQVGFEASVDIGDQTPCGHLLQMVATDTDGNERIIAITRWFKE